MGRKTATTSTPLIVQKVINRAEKADYNWMDYILLSVITSPRCNETLESLDSQGWGYVLYLYEYINIRDDIENAWEEHQHKENSKRK